MPGESFEQTGVSLSIGYLAVSPAGTSAAGQCVMEESENKPELSWVRFQVTAGLFTFFNFRLITSNMRTVQPSLGWQRWTLEILCFSHTSCKLDKRPTFTSWSGFINF